jgi:MFS family permease
MTTPTPVLAAAAPGSARPRRLNHARAFIAIAAIFVLFMAASSAPSPLYVVYQQLWRFSATTLTVIFAVYVVGLVASLLTLGALSDHIGRRPVLAAAIVLEGVSLALFAVAGNVGVLLVARVLQGIATGAAMTTLGAALIDLNPPHAPRRAGVVNGVVPLAGLAIGALGCGALVQYGPAPTHLVYELLLGGMVLAAIAVAVLPETSARRPGARRSLIPRLGVPPLIRSHLIALVPILLASWALVGLYLSLGPSIASGLLGLRSHLIGGLVVTLFCGTGALTAFVFRAADPRPIQLWSPALLTVGTTVSLVGVQTGTVWPAVAGTVVAGVGFGGSALTSFSTLVRLAAPEQRGELLAVALVISYVAFSVPAVIAGLAGTAYGLHPTAVVYAGVVIGFSALALVARIVRGRREQRA